MKKIGYWGQPVAILAFVLTSGAGMKSTASIMASTTTDNITATRYQLPVVRQGIAQRVGECRAVARSTFIYQERSTTNPIRSLQANERVSLAEGRGRNGWIAINSPIAGFIQAKDLKPCFEPTSSSPGQNLCRQVIYRGMEGVAVRERPNLNSPQIDTVFLGDQVTLSNPSEFITDSTGREWTRLSTPSGWMSNGIPTRGDINLGACLQE